MLTKKNIPTIEETDFFLNAKFRAYAFFCWVGGFLALYSGITYWWENYELAPVFTTITAFAPIAYLVFPVLVLKGFSLDRVFTVTVIYSFIFVIYTMYASKAVLMPAPFYMVGVCIVAALLDRWKQALFTCVFTAALIIFMTQFSIQSGMTINQALIDGGVDPDAG